MTEAEQVADDVGASMNAITAGEKVQPQSGIITKPLNDLELVDLEILKENSLTTLADALKLPCHRYFDISGTWLPLMRSVLLTCSFPTLIPANQLLPSSLYMSCCHCANASAISSGCKATSCFLARGGSQQSSGRA